MAIGYAYAYTSYNSDLEGLTSSNSKLGDMR